MSNYYDNLRLYAKHIEKVMRLVEEDNEVIFDSVVYDACLEYSISKKKAEERLNDAIKHYGFILTDEGIITEVEK